MDGDGPVPAGVDDELDDAHGGCRIDRGVSLGYALCLCDARAGCWSCLSAVLFLDIYWQLV